MTTEQLLLHRSHLVIIDEADALQAQAFDRAARQVLLAQDGAERTPVRELDSQFRRHCHRLPMSLEQYLRPLINHLVWLAESYVSHLVGGVIHPDRERRSMVVPRRWDGCSPPGSLGWRMGSGPRSGRCRRSTSSTSGRGRWSSPMRSRGWPS
ncbi:hypothetical protein L1856_06080 [Streptomyces sp. Tue 6430]|nr:hypothetical protein [Streptomyces sp. Tue 6430]